MTRTCFACGRRLKARQREYLVDTRDSQVVFVGADCFKRVKEAGSAEWQPPLGGPRLFEMSQQLLESADD